jgi:hypothetical protein
MELNQIEVIIGSVVLLVALGGLLYKCISGDSDD